MTNHELGQIASELCPTCYGQNTHFEISFRFWKCDDCSTVWGVGKNKTEFDPKKYHETNPDTQGDRK